MQLGANPEMDTTRAALFVHLAHDARDDVRARPRRRGSDILLKREPVLGDFDPATTPANFIWVTARDGERVPVSIVYRKNVAIDGQAPLFLYGYGSYGICIDPSFSSARLSLLDRGFVFAVRTCAWRAGAWSALVRRWAATQQVEHVPRLHRRDGLPRRAWLRAHDKVFASGGSAGGLLMGVIMNTAPEKYAGIVANVPFVDVVTTMLDETIPLTTLEYDEWGNPSDATLLRIHAVLFALRQR